MPEVDLARNAKMTGALKQYLKYYVAIHLYEYQDVTRLECIKMYDETRTRSRLA